MCTGQPSAAPETHATIVATHVIPFQSQSAKTVTTTLAAGPAGEGSGTENHTTTSASTSKASVILTRTISTESIESILLTAPPPPTSIRRTTTATTSFILATGATTSASTASTASSAPSATITSDGNQPTDSTAKLSLAQIVGISVGTAAGLFGAIALSLYLRRVRHRRLRLVPRLTGDNIGHGPSSSNDKENFRKRFRPRTGHELQISVPVNLQASQFPTRQSSGMPWQEKSNNYPYHPPQYAQNNNQDAPMVPRKNSPEVPATQSAVTRPDLGYQPYRPLAQDQAATESSSSSTMRPANGRDDLLRSESLVPPVTTKLTQPMNPPLSDTQSFGQRKAPASADGASLPQFPADNRQPKTPISARTMAYPSYYGIPPDEDRPNFGYPRPANQAQTMQATQQRSAPQPMRQPMQQSQQQSSGEMPPVFQRPPTSRDSVMTEFAEDGEDLSSRGDDDASSLFPQIQPPSQARAQPQPQPRSQPQPQQPQLRPLPQFQVRQHEPTLRPQPRSTPTRNLTGGEARPFMSPSLVPRPLSLARYPEPPKPGTRNPGNPTLEMPLQAGSNVSRMAKMRLGDERATNLRLPDNRRPQRPRQNAGWQRMEDASGQY